MLQRSYLARVGQILGRGIAAAAIAVAGGSTALAINGSQDTQLKGTSSGVQVSEIFTIGETINNYTPVGIFDGLGAYDLGNGTVRVFANHELNSGVGYGYNLASGATLTGARVSYFDIDKTTRQLTAAGPAFDTIINAAGATVTNAADVAALGDGGGLARLCSAMFVPKGRFGFEDNIFLTGEESGGANGGKGGLEYVLDAATGTLYAAPGLGYAAWESVTPLDTGAQDKTALLVGDDRAGAPLYLYVGDKNSGSGGFLDRNGLENGTMYAWKSDVVGDTLATFNGTGTTRTGTWVEISDLSSIANQDAEVALDGGFQFSRPEDVHTSPTDGTVAVLASTGNSFAAGFDDWGTTYEIDVDFDAAGVPTTGDLKILYDGDDAGAGQFAGPDYGIRSPDNLVWADNGMIYIQEDRSVGGFGLTSGEEASVWSLDPTTGEAKRVAQVDRLASLPDMQVDGAAGDIGNWETSGIIDVSILFGEDPGTLFIADVQAHGVRAGNLLQNFVNADGNRNTSLVEGGQLVFISVPEPAAGLVLLIGLAGARVRRSRG